MWWMAITLLGLFALALYEAYAYGVRVGRADAKREMRSHTFAALRSAVDKAETARESGAAWYVARPMLEPDPEES